MPPKKYSCGKPKVVEKNKYSRLRFSLGDDPLINKGYNNTTPNKIMEKLQISFEQLVVIVIKFHCEID